MADDSSSPATGDLNSQKTDLTSPIPNPNPSPTPPPPQQHSQPQFATLDPTQTRVFQPAPPYAPSQIPGSLVSNLPPPPPFRPGMQFTPVANFQNPSSGVPPPGVNSAPGSMPPYQTQLGQVQNPPGMRPFQAMANGYLGIHGVAPPGAMPPSAS